MDHLFQYSNQRIEAVENNRMLGLIAILDEIKVIFALLTRTHGMAD